MIRSIPKEALLISLVDSFNPLSIKGNYKEVWEVVGAVLLAKAEGKCEKCGRRGKRLQVHHKDNCPLNNELSNLQVLCSPCHGKAHAHIQASIIPWTVGDLKYRPL